METDKASAPPSALAPLRNPVFRAIWLSNQVSSLGWLIQSVAIGWLMATISSSDQVVALVQASSTLPSFLLSVFTGALADHYSRRRLMLIGRGVLTGSFAALTVLLAFGAAEPWSVLALCFLGGCGIAVIDPAWQASVGDIVERREIPAAVTLLSLGYNAVRSVGPAIGGVIVAAFGPLLALGLSTLSYVVPFGVMWRLRWREHAAPGPRAPMWVAIREGARFSARSPGIRAAIARGTLFGLAGIAPMALLPLVARDALAGGAFDFGVLMAGYGMGAFAGGLGNAALRRRASREGQIVLACLACAACALALSVAPTLVWAALAMALGGAGWMTAWSGLSVCVQMASPRWIVGRTIAIYYALTYGGLAAGSWLWGAVAQHVSLAAALAGAGVAMLLVAAAGMLLPIREAREDNAL